MGNGTRTGSPSAVDSGLEGVRSQFVDGARDRALAPPFSAPADTPARSLVQAEKAWEQQNPAGRVEAFLDQNTVVVWNFAVGSAELKSGHRWGLSTALAGWVGTPALISVVGSTSRTGGESSNAVLARDRAAAVAAELRGQGLSVASVSGRGEALAITDKEPGLMARDRAVTVTVERLAPIPPPEPPPSGDPVPVDGAPVLPQQHQVKIPIKAFKKTIPHPWVIVTVEVSGAFVVVAGDELKPGEWSWEGAFTPRKGGPWLDAVTLETQVTESVTSVVEVGYDEQEGKPVLKVGGKRSLGHGFSTETGVGLEGGYGAVEWVGPYTATLGGVEVRGQLELTGTVSALPGPRVLEVLVRLGVYVKDAAAPAIISAAESAASALAVAGAQVGRAALVAAPAAGYALAGAAGAVLFAGSYQWMLDRTVADAMEHTYTVNRRLGYSAVMARAVVGEAGHPLFQNAIDHLEATGRSNPEARDAAEQAVALALMDLVDIRERGEWDTTMSALSARFAMREDAVAENTFDKVHQRMFVALGGTEPGDPQIGLPALLAVPPVLPAAPADGGNNPTPTP
jgi:outer membrane protein OmpA-like peptidoglycan-associated protein